MRKKSDIDAELVLLTSAVGRDVYNSTRINASLMVLQKAVEENLKKIEACAGEASSDAADPEDKPTTLQ